NVAKRAPGACNAQRPGATTAASDTRVIPGEGRSVRRDRAPGRVDRKSTRLNSSHVKNSYAVFCLKKNNILSKHAYRGNNYERLFLVICLPIHKFQLNS